MRKLIAAALAALLVPVVLLAQNVGDGISNPNGATFVNPVIGGADTFANRPVSPPTNTLFVATDVGPTGALLRYTGTRWKPVGGCPALASLDAPSAGITNSETITLKGLAPAGLYVVGDSTQFKTAISRNNSTNSATLNIYFGTLGTISDKKLNGGALIGSTNLSGYITADMNVSSSSSVIYNNNAGTSAATGYSNQVAGATSTTPTALNGGDTTASPLWFSLAMLSGAVGTTMTMISARIEYCASAN